MSLASRAKILYIIYNVGEGLDPPFSLYYTEIGGGPMEKNYVIPEGIKAREYIKKYAGKEFYRKL